MTFRSDAPAQCFYRLFDGRELASADDVGAAIRRVRDALKPDPHKLGIGPMMNVPRAGRRDERGAMRYWRVNAYAVVEIAEEPRSHGMTEIRRNDA